VKQKPNPVGVGQRSSMKQPGVLAQTEFDCQSQYTTGLAEVNEEQLGSNRESPPLCPGCELPRFR
jgi:hypothetical protein